MIPARSAPGDHAPDGVDDAAVALELTCRWSRPARRPRGRRRSRSPAPPSSSSRCDAAGDEAAARQQARALRTRARGAREAHLVAVQDAAAPTRQVTAPRPPSEPVLLTAEEVRLHVELGSSPGRSTAMALRSTCPRGSTPRSAARLVDGRLESGEARRRRRRRAPSPDRGSSGQASSGRQPAGAAVACL
jgi:hypothetical protein